MARPGRHNKAWTKQDVERLREHYRKGTLHRRIAADLKRTLNAVESKAMELRISSRRRKKRK